MSSPARTMRGLILTVFAATLLMPGPSSAQEPVRIALPGGGEGVRLDGSAGHTAVARWADGELSVTCVQGDEHAGLAALQWMLRETAGQGAALPEANARHAGPVDVSIALDRRARAGADAEQRLLLYTPPLLTPGSTRSHFDTSASPNLLMEPNINSDLPLDGIDITDAALADLGWRRGGGLETEFRYPDAPGTGFHDPRLGAARRAALEAAGGIWARHLRSRAPVVVEARFAELFCEEGQGAALAGAAPTFVFRGFDGSRRNTWYPGPIAESLGREDFTGPENPDLFIVFNSAIDGACLGPNTGWYYGTEGDVPANRIAFLTVALHEMGHGLGFTGLVDLESGELFLGLPDIFTRLMVDNLRDQTWDEMTNSGRRKSAVRDGTVALAGDRTRRTARPLLDDRVQLTINAPADLAGSHRVGLANFGPAIEDAPLDGELALADDGTATPRFACEPLVNGANIAGKIAVIARGECTFVEKVRNAQDVGAIGVIVINDFPDGVFNMGGVDDSITIPAVMLDRRTGAKIRRAVR